MLHKNNKDFCELIRLKMIYNDWFWWYYEFKKKLKIYIFKT